MMENQHSPMEQGSPAIIHAPGSHARYFVASLVAVVLSSMILAGGYLALHTSPPAPPSTLGSEEESQESRSLVQHVIDYQQWETPQLALVVSGQMHGYIHPCGCTDPQYGGLIRRYNFIHTLRTGTDKKKGWPVVGVDLGELPQTQGIREQNLLKFDLTMQALGAMHYRAVGIGKHEIKLGLGEALTLADHPKLPLPRPVSITLADAAPGGVFHDLNARTHEIVHNSTPRLGIISMIGPDLRKNLKNQVRFADNRKELSSALNAFAKAGVEFVVVLQHEYPEVDAQIQGLARLKKIEADRKEMARLCAQYCADERKQNPKLPALQLVVILTDEPEPPSTMSGLAGVSTQVIEIGHKGKYVGLVGVYRDARAGYRLQYQIVRIGPEWQSPKGQEKDHPVIAMMERYNLELKQQGMLAKYPRTPLFQQMPANANQKGLKATYVGSDRCSDCHDHAYKVWSSPPKGHAKAMETLEALRHPSNRQFDPECVMCHTVGFKHPSGYYDPVDAANWPAKPKIDAKKMEKHNKDLRGVGCESCHGPGSEHVKNPNNAALYPIINPYAPTPEERKLEEALKNLNLPNKAQAQARFNMLFTKRMADLERFCIRCHDQENDVHWGKDGNDIVKKWIGHGIIHRTPKAGNVGAPPPGVLQLNPAEIGKPLEPPLQIETIPPKKR